MENIFTDYRSENLDYLKFLLQTGLSKEFYSQPKEIKRFSKLLENIVSLKLIKLSEVTDSLAKEISNVDLTPANIKIIENLLFSNFNELNDTIISIGNEKNINTIEIPEYFKKGLHQKMKFSGMKFFHQKMLLLIQI